MTFLAPWAAWFLAGVPVIVLLYLLKLKRRPIAVSTLLFWERVMQEKVEVLCFKSGKLFPPGFQPACALKAGFLIFATTPEAIAHFRLRDKKADARKDTPLARVSAPELARLLEHRRDHIVSTLIEQKMPPANARRNFENVVGLLGLFDHLTLSHHGGDGQATWSLRLTPAR